MHYFHRYALTLTWTGNRGDGTASYQGYGREHELAAPGKPTILGSSDPSYRGDASRWNPEEMLVGALSSCHMLWFLHLAAEAGIAIEAYSDEPSGTMRTGSDGAGAFTEVVLRPLVAVRGAADGIDRLHDEAHRRCFIANSVNFPVRIEAKLGAAAT